MILHALFALINMAQNRKQNDKKIGNTCSVNIKDAVRMVIKKRQSISAVSKHSKIAFSSLRWYVEKAKQYGLDELKYTPKNKCRQVFTNEEEILLKNYIVTASRIRYGLTRTQLKKVAYDFADHNRKIVPKSWTKNLTAGEDWLLWFYE